MFSPRFIPQFVLYTQSAVRSPRPPSSFSNALATCSTNLITACVSRFKVHLFHTIFIKLT